jgi:hypothetical protein
MKYLEVKNGSEVVKRVDVTGLKVKEIQNIILEIKKSLTKNGTYKPEVIKSDKKLKNL